MFDILTSFTEVNRFKFLNKTIKIQAMIQKNNVNTSQNVIMCIKKFLR